MKTAGIYTDNGLMVINYTAWCKNDRHDNVKHEINDDGHIVVRGDKTLYATHYPSLGFSVDIDLVHECYTEIKTRRRHWPFGEKYQERVVKEDVVRLKETMPKTYLSNHFLIIE